MIDKNKHYRTRDGREVRIYAVDGRKDDEVHGAFLREEGWVPCSWNKDGLWCAGGEDSVDLIEVRPRIQREVWVNVSRNDDNRLYYQAFGTKAGADMYSDNSRIACVRLTIDCAEGEGL